MKQGGFLSRATATLFVLATVTASTDPGPTVIVKLGGSAVTRKDKFETLNEAALTTTATLGAAATTLATPLSCLQKAAQSWSIGNWCSTQT